MTIGPGLGQQRLGTPAVNGLYKTFYFIYFFILFDKVLVKELILVKPSSQNVLDISTLFFIGGVSSVSAGLDFVASKRHDLLSSLTDVTLQGGFSCPRQPQLN